MRKERIVIISPEVFSYGAMLIGGVLKSKGFKVKLLNNLSLYNTNTNNIDIVGFSLTSILHLLSVKEVVSRLKNLNIPVIVGGPITQVPELVFHILPEVDVVVTGEGEETTPEVLEAIIAGNDLEKVEGVAFRHDDEVVKTSPRKPVDLDGRAMPEIPEQIRSQDIRGANVYVETHRGCLGNCSFCQVPCFFGRSIRSRTIEEVVAEVEAFVKAGAKRIALFGGTSNQYGYKNGKLNSEAFFDLLKSVSKVTGWQNLSVPDLRIDMLDELMLEAVKYYTIGFVIFGLESGSNKILSMMRKGITVDKIFEGVREARKFGLKVAGSFIVGYPHEDEEDYMDTKKLVEELMLDDYSIGIAEPIAGTKLAEEVVKLPEEENPVFLKDHSKLGVLHDLSVAEVRALDLMLTAAMVRSKPIPITDQLYRTFLNEVKKQGEEIRLVTRILKGFYTKYY